jgi:enamine deaminase RidA (YjgF/YER057c/UK114 family)
MMMKQRTINPWKWQDQLGFVQATEIEEGKRMLFCAGQTSMDGNGMPLHAGDMRGQKKQTMDNVEKVLSEAGFSLSDVVRLNYYTTDVDQFFANYEVVTGRLTEAGAQVSSTLLGISRLAFPELLVEIEATAIK